MGSGWIWVEKSWKSLRNSPLAKIYLPSQNLLLGSFRMCESRWRVACMYSIGHSKSPSNNLFYLINFHQKVTILQCLSHPSPKMQTLQFTPQSERVVAVWKILCLNRCEKFLHSIPPLVYTICVLLCEMWLDSTIGWSRRWYRVDFWPLMTDTRAHSIFHIVIPHSTQ